MDSDRFINTSKSFNQHQNIADDKNFFLHADKMPVNSAVQTKPLKHLNDYDANILQEGAYRDVKDEIFKLEYKISKIEDELKETEKQIQTANEIYDYFLVDRLNTRKTQLMEDLKVLTEIYREASISAKISGGITSKIRDNLVNAGKIFSNLIESILSKISGKFSTVLEVRNSLNKLENINKNVDELMNCQYPYGEAEYRYEQLSRYIVRANSIQSEIGKFIN